MTRPHKLTPDDIMLWAGRDFELLGCPEGFVMFSLGPAFSSHGSAPLRFVSFPEAPLPPAEFDDDDPKSDEPELTHFTSGDSPVTLGEAVADLDDEAVELPPALPILPVDNLVVFPHMIAPLHLDEEAHKQLVDEALKAERMIGIFTRLPHHETQTSDNTRKNDDTDDFDSIHPVGTVCVVLRMLRVPDGTMRLLVHGVTRARIAERISESPYLKARVDALPEPEIETDVEIQAMRKTALAQLQKIIKISSLSEELGVAANNVEEPGKLADLIASNIQLKPEELLEILDTLDVKARLKKVLFYLSRELQILEIGSRIQSQVKTEIDKNQRVYVLREQLKAIRQELGEEEPHDKDMRDLRERLAEKKMPDYARATVEKELGRLDHMQPASAEYGVIRTYVEWFFDLPWDECTGDNIDIQRARAVLDEDHYGLTKVKERILEFLAVLRLRDSLKGPILCFIGPPGVGKTSLGRSIARATGRRFTRFSLGGMRDEAEIRGHRRTYIGAMPGRILKSMKECGSSNPLVMLDEIDKLGTDFRGDPASALLEVLDPEQNNTFQDHYLDVPFDLSRTMFITTANQLETVPVPLRDRMEIIEIAGYTANEKLAIATQYLVPREMVANGLRKSELKFSKTGLLEIVENHTREAGVRELQRQVGSICRKTAMKVAETLGPATAPPITKAPRAAAKAKAAAAAAAAAANARVKTSGFSPSTIVFEGGAPKVPGGKARIPSVTVTEKTVGEFLGPAKIYSEMAQRMGQPGVAIGMAWTSTGGDILFIEVTRHAGTGKLLLTGQLGDVMKESAQAAMTYLHARAAEFGVDEEQFSKKDYHIHVPAGAVPKDGPSAGTVIAAALASLLSGKLVRDYLSMTGEITLRGNILPVGGIKEKCLAAQRAGIKTIVLPKANHRDYLEIPEEVRKQIRFEFVERLDEVLELALRPTGKKTPSRRTPPKTKTANRAKK